jgi:hypothetical protein
MSRYWVVVASADHVARGVAGGFAQACHGKAGPLRRMKKGDGIVCYSPTVSFGGKDRLQAFTAIGAVGDRAPYPVDMGAGFRPHRADIIWLRSQPTSIRPLVGRLALTRGRANWGGVFRFGFCEMSGEDFAIICEAMGVDASHGSPDETALAVASSTPSYLPQTRQGALFNDGVAGAEF